MASLYRIGDVYYSNLRMNGKRIRRALSSDKRFAEEKLADLVKQRQASKFGEPVRDISWIGFKERYMQYSESKAVNTHDIDKNAFRELEVAIPLDRLSGLTPDRLEAFKAWLQQNTENAIPTINRKLRAIKAAINKAIEWKMLQPDEAYKRVKYLKEAKGRLHYYSTDDMQRVFEKTKGVWQTMAYLGYYAGLRRGEIHTLRVACVDFERNRIHIEPFEEFVPKDCERRFVPMHHKLRAYLKEHMNGSAYVLGDDRPDLSVMSTYFANLMRECGLKGSLHTLRHTFASHCIMNGVPVATLQVWLGHAKLETTMIYTHLSPEHLDTGIDRIPEI